MEPFLSTVGASLLDASFPLAARKAVYRGFFDAASELGSEAAKTRDHTLAVRIFGALAPAASGSEGVADREEARSLRARLRNAAMWGAVEVSDFAAGGERTERSLALIVSYAEVLRTAPEADEEMLDELARAAAFVVDRYALSPGERIRAAIRRTVQRCLGVAAERRVLTQLLDRVMRRWLLSALQPGVEMIIAGSTAAWQVHLSLWRELLDAPGDVGRILFDRLFDQALRLIKDDLVLTVRAMRDTGADPNENPDAVVSEVAEQLGAGLAPDNPDDVTTFFLLSRFTAGVVGFAPQGAVSAWMPAASEALVAQSREHSLLSGARCL